MGDFEESVNDFDFRLLTIILCGNTGFLHIYVIIILHCLVKLSKALGNEEFAIMKSEI